MSTTIYRHPTRDPRETVARAERGAGLCACAPFRHAFEACLLPLPPGAHWPLDVPFVVHPDGTTSGVSLCGVFACWCLGLDTRPYVNGAAFAMIRRACRVVDAPAPGDIMLTDTHARVVVEHVAEYGYLETIEGGGVCTQHGAGHEGRGLQAIARKRGTWPA